MEFCILKKPVHFVQTFTSFKGFVTLQGLGLKKLLEKNCDSKLRFDHSFKEIWVFQSQHKIILVLIHCRCPKIWHADVINNPKIWTKQYIYCTGGGHLTRWCGPKNIYIVQVEAIKLTDVLAKVWKLRCEEIKQEHNTQTKRIYVLHFYLGVTIYTHKLRWLAQVYGANKSTSCIHQFKHH